MARHRSPPPGTTGREWRAARGWCGCRLRWWWLRVRAARWREPSSPLEARLRTLFPYTSYRSFTEYTKVVPPGEALELWLPDGRKASLRPLPAKAGLAPAARPIRISIEGGEEFESRAVCGHVTVVQVRGTGPHHRNGGRVFLVYEETCPGSIPGGCWSPENRWGSCLRDSPTSGSRSTSRCFALSTDWHLRLSMC